MSGDRQWDNVDLLLPFDNDTQDVSSNALTVTANGGAAISAVESKWGGSSLYLDGSDDYLSLDPPALNDDPFTIEFWVRAESVSSGWQTLYDSRASSSSSNGTSIHTNDDILELWSGGSRWLYTSSVLSANTWHHVAFSRESSGRFTIFVDGSLQAETTTTKTLSDSAVLIGKNTNSVEFFGGYLDDYRITKGFTRYTAAFTPPTQAFPTEGIQASELINGGVVRFPNRVSQTGVYHTGTPPYVDLSGGVANPGFLTFSAKATDDGWAGGDTVGIYLEDSSGNSWTGVGTWDETNSYLELTTEEDAVGSIADSAGVTIIATLTGDQVSKLARTEIKDLTASGGVLTVPVDGGVYKHVAQGNCTITPGPLPNNAGFAESTLFLKHDGASTVSTDPVIVWSFGQSDADLAVNRNEFVELVLRGNMQLGALLHKLSQWLDASEKTPYAYYAALQNLSPTSFYKLDEVLGTEAIDSGSESYPGTYQGTFTLNAGFLGPVNVSSVELTNAQIHIGNASWDTADPISVTAVAHSTDVTAQQIIWKEGGSGNGLAIGFMPGGTIRATVNDGSPVYAETTQTYADETVHIAAVIQTASNQIDLYVNGALADSFTGTVPSHNGGCEAALGNSGCDGLNDTYQSPLSATSVAAPLIGQLGAVAVWRGTALTAQQILTLHDAFMSRAVFGGSPANSGLISSSSEYSSSYSPDNAFNGQAETGSADECWISTEGSGPNVDGRCWLQWSFDTSKTITSIRMCRRSDAESENFPRQLVIFASETGAFAGEETQVADIELDDAAFNSWSEWRDFDTELAAPYLRVQIRTMWTSGSSYDWVAVQEVELKELV